MDHQQPEPASKLRLILAYATLYLVWGSTYLAIRVVVETIPPFFMASMRFFAAGLALAIYVAMTTGLKMNRQQFRDNAIIAALLLLGGTGIVSWAEKSIPSGITTLIVRSIQSSPFWPTGPSCVGQAIGLPVRHPICIPS